MTEHRSILIITSKTHPKPLALLSGGEDSFTSIAAYVHSAVPESVHSENWWTGLHRNVMRQYYSLDDLALGCQSEATIKAIGSTEWPIINEELVT